MVPVVQIYRSDVPDVVPFPDGCDLLQVLWCPRSHDRRWVVPQVCWRSTTAVGQVWQAPPAPADVAFGGVLRPCVVHPELVTEYPSWDLPDQLWDALENRMEQVEQETGWDYQYHLSTAPGVKFGGYPGWCQDPQWPDCPNCRLPMDHLLTVESPEVDAESRKTWTPLEDVGVRIEALDLMFGGVYVFECRACPGRPFTHRFDS